MPTAILVCACTSGEVSVEVTNDGVRWSSGLDFSAKLYWPGNASTVPLDYGQEQAPAQLGLGACSLIVMCSRFCAASTRTDCVLRCRWLRAALVVPQVMQAAYTTFVSRSIAAINNSSSVLPFTQLRLRVYTEVPIIETPVPDREAAAAVLLETMIADAEAAGAPLVGCATRVAQHAVMLPHVTSLRPLTLAASSERGHRR